MHERNPEVQLAEFRMHSGKIRGMLASAKAYIELGNDTLGPFRVELLDREVAQPESEYPENPNDASKLSAVGGPLQGQGYRLSPDSEIGDCVVAIQLPLPIHPALLWHVVQEGDLPSEAAPDWQWALWNAFLQRCIEEGLIDDVEELGEKTLRSLEN